MIDSHTLGSGVLTLLGLVAAGPHSDAVDYECGGGSAISVRFVADTAELALPDRLGYAPGVHVLQQRPTADGFEYAGEGFVLRGRGREVRLSGLPGTRPADCRLVTKAGEPPTRSSEPARPL